MSSFPLGFSINHNSFNIAQPFTIFSCSDRFFSSVSLEFSKNTLTPMLNNYFSREVKGSCDDNHKNLILIFKLDLP